ncbi:hypothetical protein, partial [Burkholderia cepacia]|uniref:hypothetical protein n=1 Tax=Burkholderia cepacia TaxID=292 RepID=UPI001E620B1E
AGQLTRRESGHFYVAKSGHFNLATTTKTTDNSRYVKLNSENCRHDPGNQGMAAPGTSRSATA